MNTITNYILLRFLLTFLRLPFVEYYGCSFRLRKLKPIHLGPQKPARVQGRLVADQALASHECERWAFTKIGDDQRRKAFMPSDRFMLPYIKEYALIFF